MFANERIVTFRVVSVNDHSAVVEVSVLVSANKTVIHRARMRPGDGMNLNFETAFRGDDIKEIKDATIAVIEKAQQR